MSAPENADTPAATAILRHLKPVTGTDANNRRTQFFAIPVAGLRLDLVTGFDLYMRGSSAGKFVLYRRGEFVFTEQHRQTLEESRVRYLYVTREDQGLYAAYLENNIEEIVTDPSLESDQKSAMVYTCSSWMVRDLLQRPWAGENHRRAKRMVHNTVAHLLRGPGHLDSMVRMLETDYRLFTHAVNVCVLGLGLGERAGLSIDELNELGTGLLLHDLGLSEMSPTIIGKLSRGETLTETEQEAFENHPQTGVDLLKRTQKFGPAVQAVVLQHHERSTGDGYPQGLRAPRIHLYAKICGLVDMFDVLTTGAGHQERLDTFAALQCMRKTMRRQFHPELLRLFILMLGRPAVAEEGSDTERKSAA